MKIPAEAFWSPWEHSIAIFFSTLLLLRLPVRIFLSRNLFKFVVSVHNASEASRHLRCTVDRNIILPLFFAILNRFPKLFFSWTQLKSVLHRIPLYCSLNIPVAQWIEILFFLSFLHLSIDSQIFFFLNSTSLCADIQQLGNFEEGYYVYGSFFQLLRGLLRQLLLFCLFGFSWFKR